MRHSDSSPPIPRPALRCLRPAVPSEHLRFAPSDARCDVHGLGLGEPVHAPRRSLRWRRRGLPGSRETHPPFTHATRSDPGEVAASTASETRRDDLPSNARRRPSHSMHFGAQSRGLRAPCERRCPLAPWVTPGPRITRFRLAADLGRMGLVPHRVSNKVSKITSRHLIPLDRAFPAHAKVHIARDPSDVYASTIETGYPGPCTFINRIPCGKCWLRRALSLPGALRSARS